MQDLREHLDDVQKKINYWFDNTDLLLQAFTRSSYSSQYGGENNEVLEFLGDKVLDYCVVKVISERFGFVKSQSNFYDKENDLNEYCIVAHKNEADFTEIKKQIVSNETLAKSIDKLGFFKYMYLGDTDLENPKFKDNLIKVKADLFEAILGAVDRKSTRLNSSHVRISYAVFCLKKKKEKNRNDKQVRSKRVQ